ncbi:glycoside hydrolase family protein [Oscillibacter ruminantium]|uniref:glycoside hydrolase family protein n=1 Tax=Oscillibacter ruminantium TaxID=1263547 RepID=UPI0002F36D17|nr:glycoside hydrolase family protein [Oscillibacter ruminantium]
MVKITQAGTLAPELLESVQIYVNTKQYKETDAWKILNETGGDFLLPGPIYLKDRRGLPTGPCCHLKADGETLCAPNYVALLRLGSGGIVWDNPADWRMADLPADDARNYIQCVSLIIHGVPVAKPDYQPDMAYRCPRVAIGRKQGRVAWYACRDKLTPEELRDRLVSYGWDEAIMLDGGGSTLFFSRDGGSWYCDGNRVLYSYIVFTLKKPVTARPTSTGAAGLALIKQFEGCRLKAYKPFAYEKYWTIGWGHYGPDVKANQTITQAKADAMLVEDLKKYEKYVLNKAYCPITAQLTQNQFDALVSFTYNCGPGCLQTLCKGRTAVQIAAKLPLYNKSGGKAIAGLTRRRIAEQKLFNT